jgi:hypothetical protein
MEISGKNITSPTVDRKNLRFAFCIESRFLMGRTVLPFSRVLEQEVQEWKKFRRGLRKEDQQFLDRLFEEARLHVQAGVYASKPWPFETILISILLEHEKAIVELRTQLQALENKKSVPTAEAQSAQRTPPEEEDDFFAKREIPIGEKDSRSDGA